ncbi:MAG: Z1 domain-containing protein [Thalassobaculaceae bacterium]|uniref:Z1 domain-containing protein n=1 Tax=Roseitalea porphyridii TaxID=1852022 RepID=UPI0032F01A9C
MAFEQEIAFFRIGLSNRDEVSHTAIREMIAASPFSHLSDEDRESIARILEESFDITQTRGATVTDYEHVPWLDERKRNNQIDFYYWNRLKRYYLETGSLPGRVVNMLDQVTDEVLDFCGNPADENAWKKRGMVLGHVQSGKTTNYSALICKAADAGYKIIILLAGITNSLRTQTQERLDETFIGQQSVFQQGAKQEMPIRRYGTGTLRTPAYGTSREGDFSAAVARVQGVSLASLSEPMIFVTKKNKITLERLRDWLVHQNPGGKIKYPLLLIDDEADNASINTSRSPNRVTGINGAIREILALFDQSSYVGYTATPFANIFIDPRSEDEMLGDDLFPANFIKALDPPSNYVGASRIFADPDESPESDLRLVMVRELNDFEDLIPLKHRRDLKPAELPQSLRTAVRVFLLSRAIRVLRGDGKRHSSMMINVSRFNDVQEHVEGLVYQYLEELRASVETNSGLGPEGVRDAGLNSLKQDFLEEYADCGFEWNKVQAVLPEAIRPIVIRTVNMRGGLLDYSKNRDAGLNVIAIGGLALSRGLTLEGLSVTYILRNASASDTLMQMARWFGYRPNYEDLCRLYLAPSSLVHYDFVTEATEELRSEIKRMERNRATPKEFGLKVRHSPAVIQITAANKMGSAETLTIAQDYSGSHVEGYSIPNSREVFDSNRRIVDEFLSKLPEPVRGFGRQPYWLWSHVDGSDIHRMITSFGFSGRHRDLAEIQDGSSLLGDYVADRLGSELSEWDVVLVFNGEPETVSHPPDLDRFTPRGRGVGQIKGADYLVTAKNRLSSPGDERIGLLALGIDPPAEGEGSGKNGRVTSADFYTRMVRPVMLVHLFTAIVPEQRTEKGKKVANIRDQEPAFKEDRETLVSLSFMLPSTGRPVRERTYKVNQVYLEMLRTFDRDDEEDDEAESLAEDRDA